MKLNVVKIGQVPHSGRDIITAIVLDNVSDETQEIIARIYTMASAHPIKWVWFKDMHSNTSQIQVDAPVRPLKEVKDLLKEYGDVPVMLINEGVCPTCLTDSHPFNVSTGKWDTYERSFMNGAQISMCRFNHRHEIYEIGGSDMAADSGADNAMWNWKQHVAEYEKLFSHDYSNFTEFMKARRAAQRSKETEPYRTD